MQKYLPSKKFIITFISIIITILIIWLGVFLAEKYSKKTPQISEQQIEKYQEFMALDTDNDGLKDWEEALWKTDPQKSDTDEDGTSDTEEIKINRDPLKTNTSKTNQVNDLIDQQIITDQKKAEEEFENLTETEKVSRVLLSQYIASKNNTDLDLTNKELILNSAISLIQDINQEIKLYEIKDLKIINSNDKESLKKYGNEITLAVTNQNKTVVQQELSILADAISNNNPEDLKKLDGAINLYNLIIKRLLAMNVPNDLVNNHLKIVNAFLIIKNDVEKMKLLFSDTIQTLLALEDYKKVATDLNNFFLEIKNYLNQKEVVFNQTETGYSLFNIVK